MCSTYQCIVEEEHLASNDGQVGEEPIDRAQTVEPVQQQIVADLTEVWERDGVEVTRLGVLYQNDRQVALDHRAVAQHAQIVHVTRYTHRTAHCTDNRYATVTYARLHLSAVTAVACRDIYSNDVSVGQWLSK